MKSNAGLSKSIIELAHAPVGEARHVFRIFVLPAIFSFAILCAVGWKQDDPLYGYILRVLGIVYLLFFSFFMEARSRPINLGMLATELSGLATLLSVFATLCRLDPFLSVFLPLCLVLICLALFELSLAKLLLVIASPMVLMIVYWLVSWRALGFPVEHSSLGLLTPAAAAVFLFVRAHPGRASLEIPLIVGTRTRSSAMLALHETEREKDARERLVAMSSRLLGEEAAGVFAWRLPVLCLLSASAIFGAAVVFEAKSVSFATCWVALALVQLMLFRFLLRDRTEEGIFRLGAIVTASCFCWWALAGLFRIGPPVLQDVFLGLIILAWGALPWSKRHNLALSTVALACVIFRALDTDYPVVLASASLVLVLVSIRSAAVNFLTFMGRSMTALVASYCTAMNDTMATIRVAGWHMAAAVDSSRTLLVFEPTWAELIDDGELRAVGTDVLFLRSLLQKLDDGGEEEGVLWHRDLGEQFNTPFFEWFGHVPQALFFFRYRLIVNDKEHYIAAFIPVGWGIRVAGTRRSFRVLSAIASILRMALDSSRTRVATSDAWLNTQRLVAEQESDFSRVVHQVNNTMQDIAIVCDELRNQLGGGPDTSTSSGMMSHVEQIEAYARRLSRSVSDTKLFKELARVKANSRNDLVALEPFVAELEEFANDLTHGWEGKFSLLFKKDPQLSIRVVQKEYLGSVLRGLLERARRRSEPAGRVELRVFWGAEIIFEVYDSGQPNGELLAHLKDPNWAPEPGDRDGEVLLAARRLAELSSGTAHFEDGSAVVRLSFGSEKLVQAPVFTEGQWVLLVDDSREVVTFYSRVAEALNLQYSTASSLSEAEEVIRDRGRPRLIITDVQLYQGSGIDLLRYVREQFGPQLPVIVVSGEADEGIQSQARAAGATKFLTKPVGRKKLFAEISDMLQG